MSDQNPLTPPSQPSGFEPYEAPAYGDVAPEAPTRPAPAPGPPPYPVVPPPYQVAPQYLVHPGAPTHPLATTSLVLGIIGLVGLLLTPIVIVSLIGVLCSPFAIWTGARARREIRANPQAHSGEGLATGGFVTGIIGVVLGILALLAIVLFVAFLVAIFSSASP